MAELTEVRVPDIGDFSEVPVIEILVEVGDRIQPEDALVTLESDKATMDVPAPAGGVVREVAVAVGDNVSEGSVLLRIAAGGGGAAGEESAPAGAGGSGTADMAPAGSAGAGMGGGDAAIRFSRHEGDGRGAGEPCRRHGGDCIARIIGNRRSPGSRHRRLLRRPGHRSAGRRRRPYPPRGSPCLPGE